MNRLKRIILTISVSVNLLLIAAMLICTYTAYLPSQDYPNLSYLGLMFPVFLIANICTIPFWIIFKWKFSAIPLVGLLLCAGSIRTYIPINLPSAPPKGSYKILSYNVMSFGKFNNIGWEENPIMLYLLGSDADIICLQEAQKLYIDKALPTIQETYPYYAVELLTNSYIACFSKYPLISTTQIEYPSANNGSFAYEVLMGKDTLLLINNHLESYKLAEEDKENYKSIIENYKHPAQNHSKSKYIHLTEKLAHGDSIRGIQVDSVASYIARHKDRHILACGDFNSSPISYTHYKMTENLYDAFVNNGNGLGISYNRSGMYFRIDHIFASPNVKTYGTKIDNSIIASDHYPIISFFTLE
ncbi:MAG: endonuclease/exonuclease/phosphatase family protein [Prevotellaceae bacterium]|nr:endonuclease/exonuclease/phosphatase family protein [Prevotellaceae bacterium]